LRGYLARMGTRRADAADPAGRPAPARARERPGLLFIADPSPVFLLGAARVGEQAGVQVATVSSASALPHVTRPRGGDLFLANPALWASEGWLRLQELRDRHRETGVGALVDRSRRWEVERVVRAGFRAYLDKRLLTPEVFPAVIRSLLTGGAVYLSGPLPDAPTPTARELEVLTLLREGHSVRAIAERLYLSERTVKAAINSVTRRLGASNRVEAVAMAYRLGLLPAAEPGAGNFPA
jgi:DNA-binding NarL/FixJ family response regulator